MSEANIRKPRVLLVGEASFLATGYSVISSEVFKRLSAEGRLELAELACYGTADDPRRLELDWKYYPNMPTASQEEEYRSTRLNEFGAWKFEQTCLDFRPDIVWSFRDWWADEFIGRSPLRPFFHWAHSPTVDGTPLDDQWLDTYAKVDGLFAYTDWGVEVLREHGMKPIRSIAPGVDIETFRPVEDKAAFKQRMGLSADSLVVGCILRNQVRKLFPDLIESFAQFLSVAPPELARRAYLYLHTGFPDLGWNIPRLIKEAGVGHKTLLTYVCSHCKASYPAFYSDARSPCRACSKPSSYLSNSSVGVTRRELAQTINLFDLGVQYSIAEGLGLPQVEIAACGVPVASVDYSAMSDVVRKVNGFPVKVQRYYRDVATHRFFALPDNADLVRIMVEHLSLPEPLRLRRGVEARRGVLEHYTYERAASLWSEHFRSVPLQDEKATWRSPPTFRTPSRNAPPGLSDDEYVRWCLVHVAGEPAEANGYTALRMARDLGWGVTCGGMGGMPFSDMSALGELENKRRPYGREDVMRECLAVAENHNLWESRRAACFKK